MKKEIANTVPTFYFKEQSSKRKCEMKKVLSFFRPLKCAKFSLASTKEEKIVFSFFSFRHEAGFLVP